jgi:hypothetical protein
VTSHFKKTEHLRQRGEGRQRERTGVSEEAEEGRHERKRERERRKEERKRAVGEGQFPRSGGQERGGGMAERERDRRVCCTLSDFMVTKMIGSGEEATIAKFKTLDLSPLMMSR